MSEINCSRSALDLLTPSELANALIKCSEKFTYINWLSLHYLKLTKNSVLIIIYSLTILILSLICLDILSHFLTQAFNKIGKKYNISLVLSSLLLMIITNFSDDFLVLELNKEKENYFLFGLGFILSNFLIYSCLFTGYVIFFSKIDLKKNKFIFFKDVFFLFMFFFAIFYVGFGNLDSYFIFLILIVYIFYVIYTIFYFEYLFLDEKNDKIDKDIENDNKTEILEEGSTIKIKDFEKEENKLKNENKEENEKSENEEEDENKHEDLFKLIKKEIWDTDKNLLYKIFYRLLLPIKTLFLLTIPNLHNPLIKTNYKYCLIFFSSFSSIFFFTELSEKTVIFFFLMSLLITISIFIIQKKNSIKKKTENLIFIICSLLSAVSWMNLTSVFLLEVVFYLDFLKDYKSPFLNIILFSTVSCTSEFFSIISVLNVKNGLLSFLSIFSYQIFNLYVGMFFILYFGKPYNFNIFKDFGDYVFVKVLLFFGFGSLFIHLGYTFFTRWKYSQFFFVISFFYFFAAFYLAFTFTFATK